MSTTKKPKKIYYIDGVTPSVARRILKYAFDGFFFKLEVDEVEREFKIWMLDEYKEQKINKDDIRYFKEHFYGFNFMIIEHRNIDFI